MQELVPLTAPAAPHVWERDTCLRSLASRWVGILHGCLRHHRPYSEQVAWPTVEWAAALTGTGPGMSNRSPWCGAKAAGAPAASAGRWFESPISTRVRKSLVAGRAQEERRRTDGDSVGGPRAVAHHR